MTDERGTSADRGLLLVLLLLLLYAFHLKALIIIIIIIIIMIIIIFSYIMRITCIFDVTVILTYSPPMTTDDGYYQTIFRTYLQVIRCKGEEKPARVVYR